MPLAIFTKRVAHVHVPGSKGTNASKWMVLGTQSKRIFSALQFLICPSHPYTHNIFHVVLEHCHHLSTFWRGRCRKRPRCRQLRQPTAHDSGNHRSGPYAHFRLLFGRPFWGELQPHTGACPDSRRRRPTGPARYQRHWCGGIWPKQRHDRARRRRLFHQQERRW